MIIAYHRPATLNEALALLARAEPTLPLGGGTVLNAPHALEYEVVDMQSLGFDRIESRGRYLDLGARVSLQGLLESPEIQSIPLGRALAQAARREATRNLRNMGTLAGTLVAADGRSPFACAMLALDPQLTVLPENHTRDLGEILHMRQSPSANLHCLPHTLITNITLNTETALAYEYAARSPADRPIVCVAAARWASGRLRVVVGGWGSAPRLALDAPESGGVEIAVDSAAAEAGDEWASAAYRRDAAVKLARRALVSLGL
jgi:CO/xanthine dehydrogenase FAD-binding subunit